MVYREAADPRGAEAEGEPTGPLLVLDARGRPGKKGRDGARGANGSRSGEDGDRGADAGEAGEGQPGGRVVLELTVDPASRTTAVVSGTVEKAAGSVSVSERVELSRAAPIELLATGGAGGNGGNGGDGGDGARGSRGSDATRYSSGSNGGRGGDGGDGGRGTNGGGGGDGGTVVVRTSEHDTHLLMLVRPDVRGASGGAAGKNGHGGAAGPGGSGGSSHSWTESESYTDSNGASQTRTTHHRNSGGSDGPPGRAGDSPTTRLRSGSAGASGEFCIEVRDDSGAVAQYPSCFDLRLVSYVHRNENDDGVYEPGERVFVGKIEVENVGGMPLPAHHDVIVGVTRGGWVEPERAPDGRTLTVRAPRGLAAGARHVFEREELALRLGTFAPTGPGGPLSAPETIRLYAALPDVVRSFDAFDAGAGEAQGKIVVRFPVALSPITSLHSVAAGQATRLRASVQNIASKDFGADSALGRALTLRVALAPSELSAEQVLYFDAEGKRASLASGFARPIERIAAGTRFELEGTVAIADDAPPYATARIVVTCDLAPVEVSGPPRTIQLEEFTLRVGRAFAGGTADVLFMVNNRTRAEELAAWEAHAASLGLTSATWDVALEDGVEVLDAVARGEHAFHTIVLLNNMMDTAGGERRPSTLVSKETAFALARRGIRLLCVGKGPKLSELAVPAASCGEPPVPVDATAAARLAALEKLEVGAGTLSLSVETWCFFLSSQPKSQHLEKSARKLARELVRRFPGRRYVVVPRFEVGEARPATLGRYVSAGTIEVRRAVDAGFGALRAVNVDDASVHAEDFVREQRVFFTFLCTLSFPAKLAILRSSTLPFAEDGDVVALAVVADLVAEQEALAVHGHRSGALAVPGALPLLTAFSAAFSERLTGPAASRIALVVAWLRHVARGRVRFWEWIPPFPWLRRSQQLRTLVEVASRRVTELALGPQGADAAYAVLRAGREQNGVTRSGPVHAADTLAACAGGLELRSDADVLGIDERVVDLAAFEAIAAKDAERAAGSRNAQERSAEVRAELLSPVGCSALLAADAERVRIAAPALEEASAYDFASLRDDRRALSD